MSLPKPKTQLGDHCSTIFNNTLYAFSSSAFQSISLSSGAEWVTLAGGVSTVGAECVHAHRDTPQEALYIVGGTTSNATTIPENGFMGLQRYLFNDKKWETIGLPVAVTFNLTNHGATFLETSQQIIVFSGTTWPDTRTPSANTYLIKTTAPYEITSIPAADPLLAPLVLPWGDNGALIVGGDENNRGLRTFNPETGWSALTMSLSEGLPEKGKAGVSLMNGDDGSRMLYTFDLTSAPTAVTQLLVKDPDSSKLRRRQETATSSAATASASASASTSALTASSWPTYNSTLAPSLSMDDVSVTYNGDMVVISPADDTNSLAVFDARKNSWMNTTELFGVTSTHEDDETISTQSINPSTSSTTSTVIPTRTSSATSSESSAAAATTSSSSGLTTVQILFIVLGVILAIIAALVCALVYIKRRRKQKNAQLGRGTRRMSFQDRGASFMQEAGDPLPPRFPRAAIDSWASKDIEKPGFPTSSTYSLEKNGPVVTAIGGQGVVSSGNYTPSAQGDPNMAARSSGWSKYFSGAEATNLAIPQRSYSGAHSSHSSTYTDLSISFPTLKGNTREGQIHPNPYLHNAGVGVAAGGIAAASSGIVSYGGQSAHLQRSGSNGLMLQEPGVGVHSPSGQRRGSNVTVSSLGASSYSSGVPESLIDDDGRLGGWSPVDGRREWEGRGPVASSVYPDSPGLQVPGLALYKRDGERGSSYADPGQSADNLSWLNLRQ